MNLKLYLLASLIIAAIICMYATYTLRIANATGTGIIIINVTVPTTSTMPANSTVIIVPITSTSTSFSTSLLQSTTSIPINISISTVTTTINQLLVLNIRGSGITSASNSSLLNATNLTTAQISVISALFKNQNTNLTNQSIGVPYGAVVSSGRYAPTGSKMRYLYYNGGTSGVVYNVTVVKAQPTLNVNVNGYNINAANTTVIHLPVYQGHLGATGGTQYTVSGNLSTSLLNPLALSYSIRTGNQIQEYNNIQSSDLSTPFSFSVPLNENTTLTFDAQGNANYTSIDPTVLIAPTKIIYLTPITFTNSQPFALTSNTQLPVGITNGNVLIGFNAIAFQTYETCNLNNAEFFYTNGIVVNSWMEGNTLNELQANAICTSSSSPNSLINSANVLYWLNLGQNTPNFLTSNTGSSPVNTIYLGWAGTTMNAANTLLNGVTTGEAPQLSCANPVTANSNGCSAGQYAEYDNGNTIFNFYDNFSGTTVQNHWTTWTGASSNFIQANGIVSKMATQVGLITSPTYNVISNTLDSLGYYSSWTVTGGLYMPGYAGAAGAQPYISFINNQTPAGATLFTSTSSCSSARSVSGGVANVMGVYSLSANSIVAKAQINYGTAVNSVITCYSSAASTVIHPIVYSSSSSKGYVKLQWIRERTTPANGIYPYTSVGAGQNACIATLTNPSNAIADASQYESFTAAETNCVSTFTYNVLAVNSVTVITIAHNDLLLSNSLTSITYAFQTIAADTSNSPEMANVIVTDSGANVAVVPYTSTFTIHSQPTLSTLTETNTIFNTGGSSTLSATISGGTGRFTANFVYSNGIVANTVSGMAIGATANYLFSASTANTYVFNVIATDIGTTTPFVFNTITNTITVNAASCSIAISPNTINFGSIQSGSSIATQNGISDTNSGSATASILVYGGNIIYALNNIGVSNSSWSKSSGIVFASANIMTTSPVSTGLTIPASSSNTIYFGLKIPGGSVSGPYNEIVSIENSC